MIKSKNGVTLASLVVYIVLFTSFTIFATNVSTNMNERLFNDRGEAINYTSLNKLQYNIEDSSLNSTDVAVTETTIVYSNGDSYVYDADKNVVLKNGGILCQNVESLTLAIENSANAKKVTISIGFNKYLNTMSRTIVSCVEVL